MKLIVLIGTDYHLELLPHFLAHYSRIGVDLFLCGLHGQYRSEARELLAQYPFEVVADFGTEPYADQLNNQWAERFNEVRRQRVVPGEWCLYADVDEFHEYPAADFLPSLDPHINAVMGWWVERLATSDGQLLPCSPDQNIGQQFPFATSKIFCGLSQKVMAVRGDLELIIGYHGVIGGSDLPNYYPDYLRVHHFRWNDRAAAKYASISWTRHYKFKDGRVPGLRDSFYKDIFYVNPPFPPVGSGNGLQRPKLSVILPVRDAASGIGAAMESIRTQTFADWELIVVPCGSAAGMSGMIASRANGDERIQVVDANGSLTAARHNGLLRARGGYIYCLDADHCALPDTLERLYECLEAQPGAAVAYGVLDSLKLENSPLDSLRWLGKDGFLNTGAVAIRRSALSAALADPNGDFGDPSLWWSLLSQGSAAFVGGKALSITNALCSACSVTSNATDASRRNLPPLKLAYLIVAHHQPKHLNRLIRALQQEDSYFFVHIDAKAHLSAFENVVSQFDNVTLVSDRVPVEWGTFSVVQAVLHLIQAAVISGLPFSYYTLLSGSDYPIKHKQVIANRLRNSKREYIRIDRRLKGDSEDTHAHWFSNLPTGTYFGNMSPHQGSMYWSLTADCIRFLVDFINKNPDYLDVHHHVPIPDEVFFHTLVKHSPFKEAITQDFSTGSYPDNTHHGNHFIDWAGLRQRDNLILDDRDFEDLLASDALFARKFEEHKSSKLLDLLDIYVHFCDFQQETAARQVGIST